MTETIADRVQRYVLDGSDADLRRLLTIAERTAGMTREALRRAGVSEGWRVIECGCGPLGGMAVLAELVGSSGQVVGIDFSETTVERARSVAATLELDNVEVIVADINDVDSATLGGPCDLAFTRLFLMHQVDPVHTLTRIADLLRPGGWIVALEMLREPAAVSHPPLQALRDYLEIAHETIERSGVPYRSVEDLPRSALDAGLEVVNTGGAFKIEPPDHFEVHAASLAGMRERALQSGVATAQEVDDLVATLMAAKDGDYEWVSTPFFLDLSLRKPVSPTTSGSASIPS
jgi:ubiquinone/menaquinone biosynthesis C-methylase UbiE